MWSCEKCTFFHTFPGTRCSMCGQLKTSKEQMRNFVRGKSGQDTSNAYDDIKDLNKLFISNPYRRSQSSNSNSQGGMMITLTSIHKGNYLDKIDDKEEGRDYVGQMTCQDTEKIRPVGSSKIVPKWNPYMKNRESYKLLKSEISCLNFTYVPMVKPEEEKMKKKKKMISSISVKKSLNVSRDRQILPFYRSSKSFPKNPYRNARSFSKETRNHTSSSNNSRKKKKDMDTQNNNINKYDEKSIQSGVIINKNILESGHSISKNTADHSFLCTINDTSTQSHDTNRILANNKRKNNVRRYGDISFLIQQKINFGLTKFSNEFEDETVTYSKKSTKLTNSYIPLYVSTPPKINFNAPTSPFLQLSSPQNSTKNTNPYLKEYKPGPVSLAPNDLHKTWIFPISRKYMERKYQLDIAYSAVMQNTLVSLPTGLGKTLIAAVVMYNFYRWFPFGKIVFLAPTRPLVTQQIEACYNVIGIPESHTAEMSGQSKPERRRELWTSRRLFFCTPQTMQRDLQNSRCVKDGKDVVCLVIDEAHKAMGKYAYGTVVSLLESAGAKFRIVGLSATPGKNLENMQTIISTLRISKIEARFEDDESVKPYVHSRQYEVVKVDASNRVIVIDRLLLEILNPLLDYLRERNALTTFRGANTSATSYGIMVCMRDYIQRTSDRTLTQYFLVIQSLLRARDALRENGIGLARTKLATFMRDMGSKQGLGIQVASSSKFQSLWEAIVHAQGAGRNPNDQTAVDLKVNNSKLEKLDEILVDHFKTTTVYNESSRAIVFSQWRDSVEEIVKLLEVSNESLIRPKKFVGQSMAGSYNLIDSDNMKTVARKKQLSKKRLKSKVSGMNQKEQQQVIQDFRNGIYNVLVCTCIGEEGLDIGEVDLIVNFDCLRSPIRMVQRTGRTGRHRDGRVVCLVSKGQEERKLEQAEATTKSLWRALKYAKTFLLRKNIPMIPVEPILERRKMDNHSKYRLSQIGGHSSKKPRCKKRNKSNEDYTSNTTKFEHQLKTFSSWILTHSQELERRNVIGDLPKFRSNEEIKKISIKAWQKGLKQQRHSRACGTGPSCSILSYFNNSCGFFYKNVNDDLCLHYAVNHPKNDFPSLTYSYNKTLNNSILFISPDNNYKKVKQKDEKQKIDVPVHHADDDNPTLYCKEDMIDLDAVYNHDTNPDLSILDYEKCNNIKYDTFQTKNKEKEKHLEFIFGPKMLNSSSLTFTKNELNANTLGLIFDTDLKRNSVVTPPLFSLSNKINRDLDVFKTVIENEYIRIPTSPIINITKQEGLSSNSNFSFLSNSSFNDQSEFCFSIDYHKGKMEISSEIRRDSVSLQNSDDNASREVSFQEENPLTKHIEGDTTPIVCVLQSEVIQKKFTSERVPKSKSERMIINNTVLEPNTSEQVFINNNIKDMIDSHVTICLPSQESSDSVYSDNEEELQSISDIQYGNSKVNSDNNEAKTEQYNVDLVILQSPINLTHSETITESKFCLELPTPSDSSLSEFDDNLQEIKIKQKGAMGLETGTKSNLKRRNSCAKSYLYRLVDTRKRHNITTCNDEKVKIGFQSIATSNQVPVRNHLTSPKLKPCIPNKNDMTNIKNGFISILTHKQLLKLSQRDEISVKNLSILNQTLNENHPSSPELSPIRPRKIGIKTKSENILLSQLTPSLPLIVSCRYMTTNILSPCITPNRLSLSCSRVNSVITSPNLTPILMRNYDKRTKMTNVLISPSSPNKLSISLRKEKKTLKYSSALTEMNTQNNILLSELTPVITLKGDKKFKSKDTLPPNMSSIKHGDVNVICTMNMNLEDTPESGLKETSSELSLNSLVDKDTVCAVCLNGDSSKVNPIVLCDGPFNDRSCPFAMHKLCYNINICLNSTKYWRCDVCEEQQKTGIEGNALCVTCCICSQSNGVKKSISRKFKGKYILAFVHPLCLFWSPWYVNGGVKSKDAFSGPILTYETITSRLNEFKQNLKCEFCNGVNAVKCAFPSCMSSSHPYCSLNGQQKSEHWTLIHGRLQSVNNEQIDMEQLKWLQFCTKHTKESIHFFKMCDMNDEINTNDMKGGCIDLRRKPDSVDSNVLTRSRKRLKKICKLSAVNRNELSKKDTTKLNKMNSSNKNNLGLTSNKDKRNLGTKRRHYYTNKYQFLDVEAIVDSDVSEDEEDNYYQTQNSFINDSSQLGYTLDSVDVSDKILSRSSTPVSFTDDKTIFRQLDNKRARLEQFATPMLNRNYRNKTKIISGYISENSPSYMSSGEWGFKGMNFIRNVIEHHKQGGTANDIEKIYNSIV